MSKEVETPELEESALSPEEMEEKRKELLEFYESELPLMRARAEYEKLATDIEGARFERLQIRIAHAQIMAGPEPEGEMPEGFAPTGQGEPGTGAPAKKRTLKKQD